MPASRELTDSERDWLGVRAYVRQHRYELAVKAADEYPTATKVDRTPLLTRQSWIPSAPIPLAAIDLDFQPGSSVTAPTSLAAAAAAALPERADHTHYERYSDVVASLAAPTVFENRSTYRLLGADLSGPRGRLTFDRGMYFDGIDTGEAAAHEYAATQLGASEIGLRHAIGDPCDLTRRPTNLAISTLTIRHDRTAGQAEFLVHWRDPAKVGHAGGLYQVIPVGIFQASGEASWNERNDFDLWRGMVREFNEELRGASEDYNSENAPIDYARWPFAAQMTTALEQGRIRAYCVGLGVDPLTFATDALTVVVIDAPVFDGLFGARVSNNAEGQVLAAKTFDHRTVAELVHDQPMQAAGAALLSLAWRHRATLLT